VVDVPEGGGGMGVRGEGVGARQEWTRREPRSVFSPRSVFFEETLFLRTRASVRLAPDRVSTRASEGKKEVLLPARGTERCVYAHAARNDDDYVGYSRLLHLQLASYLPHLRGFPGVRRRGLGPYGLDGLLALHHRAQNLRLLHGARQRAPQRRRPPRDARGVRRRADPPAAAASPQRLRQPRAKARALRVECA